MQRIHFINNLNKNLYEDHFDFASNPLLFLVMVLTFINFGNVAKALPQFLQEALDTLYERHDASKPGLTRARYANLDKQEYLRFLPAIAAITYLEERVSFSYEDGIKYAEKAASIAREGLSL